MTCNMIKGILRSRQDSYAYCKSPSSLNASSLRLSSSTVSFIKLVFFVRLQAAIKMLDGAELDGRTIAVREDRQSQTRKRGPYEVQNTSMSVPSHMIFRSSFGFKFNPTMCLRCICWCFLSTLFRIQSGEHVIKQRADKES